MTEAGDYLDILRGENGVIADPAERKALIWNKVQQAAAEKGAVVPADPELLDDVNNLVESPDVIMGSFDPKYLELPDEVIVTAMREHQKYFAVRDSEGKLLPAFIGVINGTPKDKQVVIRSNEAVIKAPIGRREVLCARRYEDLDEEWAQKLSGITWLEGMGTMLDKSQRLAKLVGKIGNAFDLSKDSIKTTQAAALLCKADLATNIIREKEFNSLQGVMGGIYVAKQGQPETGAAIKYHYYPRFSGDQLPPTKESSLLSLADKMDTIVGCFKARIIPTGSQDPFALRRQAVGVLQIILENRYGNFLRRVGRNGSEDLYR